MAGEALPPTVSVIWMLKNRLYQRFEGSCLVQIGIAEFIKIEDAASGRMFYHLRTQNKRDGFSES